jgi:hypothetical protein
VFGASGRRVLLGIPNTRRSTHGSVEKNEDRLNQHINRGDTVTGTELGR